MDTWTRRDLPLLLAAAHRLEAEPAAVVFARNLAGDTNLDPDDCVRAAMALLDVYLIGQGIQGLGPIRDVRLHGLTERGRRTVGLWPSDRLPDEVAELLMSAADQAPDEQQASRLRSASVAILSVGRDVIVDVLGTAISGRVPL